MGAVRFDITTGPVQERFAAEEIECSAADGTAHWATTAAARARVRRDPLLRALLAPVDEHTFVTRYLGQRVLHTHSNGDHVHRRVLTLDGLLEAIADQRAPRDALTFLRGDEGERKDFDPSQFIQEHRGYPLHDFERIRDYVARGRGSMIAQAVDHWVPSVRRLAMGLAEVVGARTGTNAYYTPARSRALATHWDTHDVLVVQVHGTKRWRVWEPLLEHPLPKRPHMESSAYEGFVQDLEHRELVLHAGDTLYLPAGTPHEAWTEDDDSLHLTNSIEPLRWHDVLRDMVEQALLECEKEIELRMPCPAWFLGPRDELVSSQRADVLERMVHHLGAVRMSSTLARSVAAERAEPARFDPHPPAVELDTVLERAHGLAYLDEEGDPDDETVSLVFGARRICFPKDAAAAVHWILDHEAIRPADLPGLADVDRIAVARTLESQGLLHHRHPHAAVTALPQLHNERTTTT